MNMLAKEMAAFRDEMLERISNILERRPIEAECQFGGQLAFLGDGWGWVAKDGRSVTLADEEALAVIRMRWTLELCEQGAGVTDSHEAGFVAIRDHSPSGGWLYLNHVGEFGMYGPNLAIFATTTEAIVAAYEAVFPESESQAKERQR